MQNKIVNFVNEAVSINSEIFSKSVNHGVVSGQKFVQQVSDQTVEWVNIKNLDDYVASQKVWNASVVDQIQSSAQSSIDLGNEAYDAYFGLWKKVFEPAVSPVAEAKVVKAKAA